MKTNIVPWEGETLCGVTAGFGASGVGFFSTVGSLNKCMQMSKLKKKKIISMERAKLQTHKVLIKATQTKNSTEDRKREELKIKKKTWRTWKLRLYLEEEVRLSAQVAPLWALVLPVLPSLLQLAL